MKGVIHTMPIHVRLIASLRDPIAFGDNDSTTLGDYLNTVCPHTHTAMIYGPYQQQVVVHLDQFDGFDRAAVLDIRAVERPASWDAEPFPALDSGDVVLSDYLVPDDTVAQFRHSAA